MNRIKSNLTSDRPSLLVWSVKILEMMCNGVQGFQLPCSMARYTRHTLAPVQLCASTKGINSEFENKFSPIWDNDKK